LLANGSGAPNTLVTVCAEAVVAIVASIARN
jgi:hypothetical protein